MGINIVILIKYLAVLAVIAVLFGILAGVIAAKVDLSLLLEYFPLIFSIIVVANIALIAIAVKKGRIP